MVPGPDPDRALRASFPGAVTIDPPATPSAWKDSARRTALALGDQGLAEQGRAVFGACLVSDDGAHARIDVLAHGEHGLRMFKVRYATVADELDVDEVALWAHVAARCGLRLETIGLLLVDTEFTYPGHGCYAGLFREVDLTPVLGARPVLEWLVAMRGCDLGVEPSSEPGVHCRRNGGCEFTEHCRALGCAAPATVDLAAGQSSLEIVGRDLATELRLEGHRDLHTVPLHRLCDARHRRALLAIQGGAPVLEPAVAALMRRHPYPRRMLRFDTVGFAVPVWTGTQPYQTLPFQWTCDLQAAPGERVRLSFLADHHGDPRRLFALTLLEALGGIGPIFAYNAGFERNRIRDLAQHFDDLRTALEALLPRIVDLFQVARLHYYHPAMCGSWSFGSICRAVAPELDVSHFDCLGETSPQAAFARSLRPGLDAPARGVLRDALRAHGKRQIDALHRLVSMFEQADSGAALLP